MKTLKFCLTIPATNGRVGDRGLWRTLQKSSASGNIQGSHMNCKSSFSAKMTCFPHKRGRPTLQGSDGEVPTLRIQVYICSRHKHVPEEQIQFHENTVWIKIARAGCIPQLWRRQTPKAFLTQTQNATLIYICACVAVSPLSYCLLGQSQMQLLFTSVVSKV